MSEERCELGRRRVLLLGVAATVCSGCGGGDVVPLGGPYGGDYSPGSGGTDGGLSFGSGTGTTSPSGPGTSSSGTGTASPSSGTGTSSSGTGTSSGNGSGTGTTGGGTGPGSGTGTAPPPNCGTSNTFVADFATYPGLMTVGSGVTVSPPGYSDGSGNDSLYVVQESAGSYLAYSLSCTHQGYLVNKSGTGWRCPRHGATFSASGAHVSGPGSNLKTYSTCADAAGVTISL